MKIRIDRSVFEGVTDAASQLELSFLLHIIVYKHRYDLKVTDTEVLCTDSYGKLTQTEQDIIQQELAYTITASADAADCEVAMNGETEDELKIFSPAEAIVYLLQPLSVILENGLNDAHFMKAIFQCFDSSGELMHRVDEGWIRFENAGGCMNVKNFLTARMRTFGDKQKFLNCYVVLDGDRRYPTDPEPDKKYKKLKKSLEAWGVGYHVLEKRCMENYMPDEAVSSFANAGTQAWITAYHTLTSEQKDFFSAAEGFSKDISREQKTIVRKKESKLMTKDKTRRKVSYVRSLLPRDEQLFYSSVSRGNFLHLEKGLNIGDFKVKFPEKYNDRTVIYKANMLNRTNHQTDQLELEHIAAAIRAII